MADLARTTRPAHAETVSQPRGRERGDSFRLIAVASIFLFVLLYVFSVQGVQKLLDVHFREQVELAVAAPDGFQPVSVQIQEAINTRILQSPWVRIGGVDVSVIVLGRDGSYLYVGGRVVQPPPSVEDVTALLREAQRLLMGPVHHAPPRIERQSP